MRMWFTFALIPVIPMDRYMVIWVARTKYMGRLLNQQELPSR